jgi:hypothetical protein
MAKVSKILPRRLAAISGLALLTFALGAWCDDIPACDGSHRIEFVTRGAGDAVAVNKASQTITPWPAAAKNRHLNMNGKRASLAMERYETNRSIPPRPLNANKLPELPTPDNTLQAPLPNQ